MYLEPIKRGQTLTKDWQIEGISVAACGMETQGNPQLSW